MDFGRLKISTLLLRYVVPQMIGLVFNSIYFIVDGVFIGQRLGAASLAAAGAAVPVVEGIIALSMLIAAGTGILVSSAFGRQSEEEAVRAFNVSLRLTLALSLAVAAAGSAAVTPLARFLGANESILGETVIYLRYFFAFSPFLVFSFVLSTCVRNDGRPGLAMWALTIGSLLNILLDYVFMYPLGMGMAGAALATGLGPLVSVLLLLPHFLRRRGRLHLRRRPGPARGVVSGIAKRGFPAFVTEFSIGLVTLLYNRAIVRSGLGEQGLAVYVVIGYAALISLTAFLGAAQGLQPAVSFLSGAGEEGRIRELLRASCAFVLGVAVACYAALFFAGEAFFGLFIRGEPQLLAYTAESARLYFLCLPFAAVNILLIAVMQSSGSAGAATWLSFSRSTLPVYLFLLLLPALMPQAGLWLAAAAAELLTLLAAALSGLVRRRKAAGVQRAGEPARAGGEVSR